ncbi:MAG: Proton/sodium-glutamate symport protein [Planctomycetota bacterium]|jgi:DAACS family dicarboxylate/amino acid:cation (Na+ or H+) symporter
MNSENHNDQPHRGLGLHWKILIGLAVGALAGILCNLFLQGPDGKPIAQLKYFADNVAYPLGEIFLRLIFMVVVPLVFCALTLGVAEIGDVRRLGRLGGRTLIMTLLFSAASVLIGLTLANTLQPGKAISAEATAMLRERFASQANEKISKAQEAKTPIQTIVEIIPRNPLQEAVGALDGSSPGSGMLGVMFFSLCFGIALTLIPPERSRPVIDVLQGIYDAVMIIIGAAMRFAPIGVAALIFSITAVLGLQFFVALSGYVIAVLAGLSIHMFIVYSLAIFFIAGRSPVAFFRDILEVMLTAFGTSSSNATLPTSLRVVEDKLHLDRKVSHFVLTIGSTANQNGTALYEGMTVLFLAQVFGVNLDWYQQFTVVILSILAGVGTAGVPGGSLPLVVLVLQTINVPPEGIALIMGVDRLLDMSRTTVNVVGDIAVAACVDRWEQTSGG